MDGSTRTPPLETLLGQERWLQTLARRLVRDAATADDLVQETWFRALKARDRAASGRPAPGALDVRSWLGRVLRNVWRERGRSEHTRARREATVARSEALPSAREALERVELRRRLASLVLELEEPYRSTLVLRYYEGRNATEIAERLGEPPARVRWRLMRARELLRERLERDQDDWTLRYSLFLPLARRSLRPTAAAAGVGGLGVLSMSVKMVIGLGAAALVVWTLTHLGGGEAERGSGARPAGEVALASSNAPPALVEAAGLDPVRTAVSVPALEGSGAPAITSAGGTLHGVVRAAEDGHALDQAEVALFEAGEGRIQARTRSNASGAFRFEGLEPGRYDVAARTPDRLLRRIAGLELDADRSLEIELESGFAVAVDVTDQATGNPVAGAEVQLIPGDKDTVVWLRREARDFRALVDITDASGRASPRGAARGTHQYFVRADGYATTLGEALLEPEAGPLSVRVGRGGAVSGTVLAANGTPVEGARVFLNSVVYVKALSELALRQNGLVTDALGRYRLEGVPEGGYNAVALLPDGSGTFHFDPRQDGRSLGLVIVETSAEVTLDFHLPLPGRVHGRVIDPDGEPIEGARVSVSWGDFKAPRAGFFPISSVPGLKESIHHSTHTDPDGRFAIETLRASHRPFQIRIGLEGHVDAEIDLEVPPGVLVEPLVTLERLGGTIRGRLLDAQGEPVAGQQVGAFETHGERLGNFFHTRSAADGTYELTVASGSRTPHRVYPILHQGDPCSADPEQREGILADESGIDFVLHPKHRLHGRVQDETGTLVRDFVVHGLEHAVGSEPAWKAQRDANRGEGRLDLFVDPATLSQLRVSAPGCEPAVITALVDPAERTFVLRRADDLDGIVVDEDGLGVAGVVVALATLDSAVYPLGTEFAPRDTTDADGRFRLRGLPEAPLVPEATPSAARGHLLVCPQRPDAPVLLHFALPERGVPARLVLPRARAVELEFLEADDAAAEGHIVILDPEGWPLEPALEAHLSDLGNETRGRLVDGRSRVRLLAGLHHVLFVREAGIRATFSFEVTPPDATDAPQEQVFRVPDGQ